MFPASSSTVLSPPNLCVHLLTSLTLTTFLFKDCADILLQSTKLVNLSLAEGIFPPKNSRSSCSRSCEESVTSKQIFEELWSSIRTMFHV